jgi:hypothetical protein
MLSIGDRGRKSLRDPVAARNLAALLVRASEEAERMRSGGRVNGS